MWLIKKRNPYHRGGVFALRTGYNTIKYKILYLQFGLSCGRMDYLLFLLEREPVQIGGFCEQQHTVIG